MIRRGERILGPYPKGDRWRVVKVDAAGNREDVILETEAKAQRYVEVLRAELDRRDHTTDSALAEYRVHLTDKGTKLESIEVTAWAVELFFPSSTPLALLTAKRCARLYEDLRTRPSERTGKPLAVDTHRNVLAQVKSFLGWCVERGHLDANPAAEVKGIGRRRPRGKSLGKEGRTLRITEARAWYAKALELAAAGDAGATAALVALLLGMRASEIVSRRVRDLDTDRVAGDVLWIPCSKTPAGRRTLEVPGPLRELLVARVDGAHPERFIFEASPGRPHWRDWIIGSVHRVCAAAKVPKVTAHAMRGLLATISAERGLAGHLIAATLGHEDERTTMHAYAAPGAATAGVNRRGLVVLEGGAARK